MHYQTPEASICLKDFLVNLVTQLDFSVPEHLNAWQDIQSKIRLLFSMDENEALRFAALPTALSQLNWSDWLPQLREIVKKAIPVDGRCPRYLLQHKASLVTEKVLQNLRHQHVNNDDIQMLLEIAGELDDWVTGFLGLDLIALLLPYLQENQRSTAITLYLQLMQKAIDDTEQRALLPAPVIASLLRLVTYAQQQPNDRFINCLVNDAKELLSQLPASRAIRTIHCSAGNTVKNI